jgi:AsmA protein
MKKLAMIFGSITALILGAIIVIPLVVDVNQYNPQIVKLANEHINGTLKLGKLSLKLWGRIHIGIDGLELKDEKSNPVLSVKDASFDMPYLSIFAGSPLITLQMVQPEIKVIKTKDGKINVMGLVKAGATTDKKKEESSNAAQVALPAMALNARIGVSIENAKLVYRDEVLSLSNTIDRLNFRVKDFSLSRKTEIELWADLNTKMGSDLKVQGPLKLVADLSPDFSEGVFKSATVNAVFTADDLQMEKGDLFIKKKGIATNFQFNGSLTQDSLHLKQATSRFHNAEIVVKGEYDQKAGANIQFEAKPIDLKPWSELVPMLKAFELEGVVSMKGDIKGTPDALQYHANIRAQDFAVKGPNLKAKPIINAELQIATDQIQKFSVNLKGPGNEMILEGKLNSFSKPQISFSLTSPRGMDLDQWVEFPKADSKKAEAVNKGDGSEATASAGKPDFDAMLEPIRKNEMMKAMTMDGSVNIAFIKAMNVRMDDLVAKIQMKNLAASLSGFKMKMYGGLISGGFSTDLKPADPQYSMNLNVSGFDLQKAVESQFTSFKDTIVGTLSSSLQGSGSSFNADEIKKKLQLKGDFKITNAMFKSIDVAKMANVAIGDSISKIATKVPVLQGKKVNIPANKDTRYELVSSNYSISGGFLEAPNFYAKAAAKSGIDIKGYTKMGLVDESLDAKWELIDSQHLIEPLNISIGNRMVNNALAKGDQDPLILPITVGCKWSAPCPSYTVTAEYLAGVTAGRVAKAAGEEVKAKAKSVVEDAVKKAIGGGNPLKGLFGR